MKSESGMGVSQRYESFSVQMNANEIELNCRPNECTLFLLPRSIGACALCDAVRPSSLY
jgi:hypothetical protein